MDSIFLHFRLRYNSNLHHVKNHPMTTTLKFFRRRISQLVNKTGLRPLIFRLQHRAKENFNCPICLYHGPFKDLHPETGTRKHAQCPKCGSLERHRLQYVAMIKLKKRYDFPTMHMLHFAPEDFFRDIFRNWFSKYVTADLMAENVDYKADITRLPFDDESYDFVFASHVLEHIKDDQKALEEIRRILKPNGIAVLPVPLVAHKTIEYPEPNPHEAYHVRAPGVDYFERYKSVFSRVEELTTEDFPPEYQLYIYENRSVWPTDTMPLRPPMSGEKHIDVVPVCYGKI